MSPVWLLILLLFFLYVYYRWGYAPFQVFKRMNIPGPPPLPFLGNLLPLIIRKEGMDVIAEWGRQYGAVYGYFKGTNPFLATTDPELIQQVFITNFKHFPVRALTALMNSQTTGLPPGIFECDSLEQWRKIRHITMPAFTNRKLRMMSCHLERSCSVMVDRMVEETATGHSTCINGIYKDCVLEISVLAVLGQEVWLQRGEASDFKVMMELGYNINHGRNALRNLYYVPTDMFISHHFPWLVKAIYWLRPGWYLPAFRSLKTIVFDCIRDRREKAKSKQLQEKSVLDVIVAASETEENGQLSDNQILSHCLNFLFAAYDTTSLTLTCASHLLATNTHVQDKLCALLDDYWSQHQDASVSTVAQEVPYLDMVIDETMRLYSPAPRITRICQKSIEVCGIPVHKGMNISVPVHYLHRMNKIWGDPDVFRPERFEKEESAGRHPCCFMPMGIGPRNCVGLKLAKLLMKIALVSLLKKHRFTRTHLTEDTLHTYCHTTSLSITSKVFVDLQPRK